MTYLSVRLEQTKNSAHHKTYLEEQEILAWKIGDSWRILQSF